MAKEGKNKFQLNKGTDHGFDISKGSKRKFDLTKDVDEPVITPAKSEPIVKPISSETGNPVTETKPDDKNNKKWIIWTIAIIIIILFAWLLWPKSTTQQAIENEVVEEVTVPEENSDTAVDEATIPEEQTNTDMSGEETPSNTGGSSVTTPSTPVASSNSASTPATNSTSNSNSVDIPTVPNDIEAEALKVIRGDYGVGKERKAKLGSKYQTIQSRVNELKRQGIF